MVEWIKPGLNVDWVGRRKVFYWISGVAAVISLLALVGNTIFRGSALNYGTDFRGGSQVHIEFARPVDTSAVRKALDKANFQGATVVKLKDDRRPHFFLLRLSEVSAFSPEQQKQVRTKLDAVLKGQVARIDYQPGGDKVYVRLKRDDAAKPPASLPASAPASQPASQPAGPAEDPARAGVLAAERETARQIEEAFAVTRVEAQQVQRFGKSEDRVFEVTLAGLDRDMRKVFDSVLGAGSVKDVPQVEAVGAKMGKQLRDAGVKSVIYSLLLILLYVALRFDFRYAPGGVIALAHDVFITTGLLAFTWTEFSMTAVAALLTLAGYSINDTIVIYDRIRENVIKYRDRSFPQIVNTSLNETMSRTILTSFATLLTTFSMWVFGTGDVAIFSFVFTFGIFIGCYSTIAIATPLVLAFSDMFVKRATASKG